MAAPVARFYFRISEDKTGERLGVDRQEPASLELCARLGFTAGERYIDNDISATTGKVRPEFERLLADTMADPQPIVVWHTDRLIRLTDDLERVIKTEVNVHAVHAGHFDLSTPAGRAVARTVTAWAQYEGEQKAIRQKESNLQRAKFGKHWWPTRPFGFERSGLLREAEAAALRQAYDDLLNGVPVAAIARKMNDAGLTSPKGKPWTQPTLRQVLLNARNAGIRVYNGEEIGAASWTAIVPEEVYRAAVTYMSNPARRTGGGGTRTYLLTGILSCAVCGGDSRVQWVGVESQAGEDPRHNYAVYTCRRGHCFTAPVVPADSYVVGLVRGLLETPEGEAAWAGESEVDLDSLRSELRKLDNRLEEFQEERANGDISGQEYRALTAKVKVRKAEVEAELAKAGVARAVGNARMTAGQVVARWEELDLGRRRTVIQVALRRLAAKPRGRGVHGPWDGDKHLEVETFADPESGDEDGRLRLVVS